MARRKWGVKRTCRSCGARFYDMAREKPRCPKCGAEHAADKPAKPRRRVAPPPAPPEPPPPPVDKAAEPPTDVVEPAEDDEQDDNDENDLEQVKGGDDGLIEDASELREDDDDVSEVRDHLDNGVEDPIDDKT